MPLADLLELKVERTGRRGAETPQGPMRWARAAQNAQKKPNSHGAKLYNWRVAVAKDVARRFSVHQDKPLVIVHGQRRYSGEVLPGRREYACSITCAAMLAQLSTCDEHTVDQYVRAFEVAYAVGSYSLTPLNAWRMLTVERVDLARLDRTVTCRVCGVKVDGDKQTVKAIEKKTADTDQYVLVDGEFVPVSTLQVADLTARDLLLLNEYSTPEKRAAYVRDYGRRFDT